MLTPRICRHFAPNIRHDGPIGGLPYMVTVAPQSITIPPAVWQSVQLPSACRTKPSTLNAVSPLPPHSWRSSQPWSSFEQRPSSHHPDPTTTCPPPQMRGTTTWPCTSLQSITTPATSVERSFHLSGAYTHPIPTASVRPNETQHAQHGLSPHCSAMYRDAGPTINCHCNSSNPFR
jgi:hypothetical protein